MVHNVILILRHDTIKSMYTENKCSIKIGDKHTDFLTQRTGICQGCNLSPKLFNIYINQLAVQLDQCTATGLQLQNGVTQIYADDLVLTHKRGAKAAARPPRTILPELGSVCKPPNKHYQIMIFQKKKQKKNTKTDIISLWVTPPQITQ